MAAQGREGCDADGEEHGARVRDSASFSGEEATRLLSVRHGGADDGGYTAVCGAAAGGGRYTKQRECRRQ